MALCGSRAFAKAAPRFRTAGDTGDDDSLRLPVRQAALRPQSHGGAAHEVSVVRLVRPHSAAPPGASRQAAPEPERETQPDAQQETSAPPADSNSRSSTGPGPLRAARRRPAASTFVPIRAGTEGLNPEATAIAMRRPPRWTRLLSRRVEPRWYNSLVYPASNVPIFFRLATMLSVLLSLALLGWLSIDREETKKWPYGLLAVASFLLLLVLGRILSYFNGILALACEGKVKHDASIEFEPFDALASCGEWLACLAAGPAFLFGSALGYWLYCGDLTVVDWLILVELGFVGVGWWLLAILLINVNGRFRVPSPVQVARTAWGMGLKTLEITLLATGVFLVQFFAAAYGIGHLHDRPHIAFPLLCIAATTVLYLTAFTFRRLGLAYYRLTRRRPSEILPSAGETPGLGQTYHKAVEN